MRRSAILGLAAAGLLAAAVSAGPASADAAGLRWELGIRTETPTWVRVPEAEGRTRLVWTMFYTVENKTGETRKPAVRAEIRTDTGKKFPDTNDALAVLAVKKKHQLDSLPTAVDLLKGIEDGKSMRCLATFGAVDDRAKKLELRIYGLHDPIHAVKGKQVHEIRYWCVKYERKGDEFGRSEDDWKTTSSGWVTEEPEKKAEN
jgi:hypothetical protein